MGYGLGDKHIVLAVTLVLVLVLSRASDGARAPNRIRS